MVSDSCAGLVKLPDFPLWLQAAHFFNFLLLSLLVRSSLEILSAHPRLYWNDHCTPGSEWLKFTRKQRPKDRLWTASDEETSFPSGIALPGHENLGLGRHWHFLADFGWLLTGLSYVALLFVTPEWRLIPTSWHIFPGAWHAMLSYPSLHVVETPGAYNALQQLSYASVVFLLAPFSIATGLAMSVAIAARFPWYIRIFHGRQSARSLHFLALCTFILFFIVHVVALHGFRTELAMIVLGKTRNPHLTRALLIWLSGLTGVVTIHVVMTICSRCRPRFVQRRTESITNALRTLLFGHVVSAQHYSSADISPYFWVNGRPPVEDTYSAMARHKFATYTLEIGGLVKRQLHLTLMDLPAMPKQTQITKHCCIQGWSDVAEWGGVSLSHIVELCQPLPSARYVLFHAFDNKSTSEPHAQGPGYFYGTIRVELAADLQTMLAYEMNGEPLGSFTLHNDASRPAVFLAGGIGITPFRSMIVDAAGKAPARRIMLFYSNPRPEDAAFFEELREIGNENKNCQIIGVMTEMEKSKRPWNGETGYVDKAMLARLIPDISAPIYYTAGPPPMVAAMQNTLASAEANEDDIRSEDFSGY